MEMMGALPDMARGPSSSMGRFGVGRGAGGGPMAGGFGRMMGLPAEMLDGRPGGPLGIPVADPRGMDAGFRQPPMCPAVDPGSRTMVGGGGCGMKRPPDVMQPPMSAGRSSPAADTGSAAPSSTTSATELLSGRAGGMVGSLAATPGAVILGLPQPKKSDSQPAPAEVPPPLPASGSGPPPPTSKKAEPLPPPRMLNDEEERALLQGRGILPPVRSADRDASSFQRPAAAAVPDRRSDPQPSRSESRSRGRDDDDDQRATTVDAAADREACTTCQAGGLEFRAGKKCPHAFCVSCVQSYFSHGETECPVCGVKDELSARTLTQPASGHMLTTYENGFKLPGFETTSRGTIVVTYSFPAGIQTASANIFRCCCCYYY